MCKDAFQINQEKRSGDDRRKLSERRQYSYTYHIPERRSGKDKRSKPERWQQPKASDAKSISIARPLKK